MPKYGAFKGLFAHIWAFSGFFRGGGGGGWGRGGAWGKMSQKAMTELFGVGVPAISKHLQNIFADGELDEKVVISILETTAQHGAIKGKTQTKVLNFLPAFSEVFAGRVGRLFEGEETAEIKT